MLLGACIRVITTMVVVIRGVHRLGSGVWTLLATSRLRLGFVVSKWCSARAIGVFAVALLMAWVATVEAQVVVSPVLTLFG